MKNTTAYKIATEIAKIFVDSPILPKDTKNFKDHGINALELGRGRAAVVFGGEVAPYAPCLQFAKYAGRPFLEKNKLDKDGNERKRNLNKHRGFVEKIIENEVIPSLEAKYGKK